MTTALSAEVRKNYVAGAWVEGAKIADDINPSDTNDVVGRFAHGDAAQANAAVAAAKHAFPAWSHSTIQLRHDILKRVGDEILARKDEIGRLLSQEEGKTLAEGVGEVTRAGQIFLFFSGECLRLAGDKVPSVRPNVDVEATREPVGVVGLITPWNFPIAIPAWKLAPALAYGNCVVLKPAELVPATAHALADIITRAGTPAGVFNLVMRGRGRPPRRAGLHRLRPDEEGAARDGRQEPAGRARRCGPQDRGRLRGQR